MSDKAKIIKFLEISSNYSVGEMLCKNGSSYRHCTIMSDYYSLYASIFRNKVGVDIVEMLCPILILDDSYPMSEYNKFTKFTFYGEEASAMITLMEDVSGQVLHD